MWIIETRHLVAERFAPASALDDEQAFSRDKLFNDLALAGMKACRDVKAFPE